MRVLLTGARGFIGTHVLSALVAAGHEVIACARREEPALDGAAQVITCDFARDVDPAVWIPRLQGMNAVVNCAGILRERGDDQFERVHVEAPVALFTACAACGVRRVIQISTLGHPEDADFVVSKHRGDFKIAALELDWTILRPSVVYSADGSYGGTSLLRALAALPGVILVPGDGQQQLAPVSAQDLSTLIVRLLETGRDSHRILEVAGPEAVSLESYLRSWRRWLGFPEPRVLRVPDWMVACAAAFGDWFGTGPLGNTMLRMLDRGSIADPRLDAATNGTVGWQPRRLQETLTQRPSFVQDRWHARLYFVAPLLRLALALVWIGSGIIGWMTPREHVEGLLSEAGIHEGAFALSCAASTLDLVLGAFLLFGKRIAATGVLMLVSLAAYTVFVGVLLPRAWLEPFGGLLKNIALVPAVLAVMVLSDRK